MFIKDKAPLYYNYVEGVRLISSPTPDNIPAAKEWDNVQVVAGKYGAFDGTTLARFINMTGYSQFGLLMLTDFTKNELERLSLIIKY